MPPSVLLVGQIERDAKLDQPAHDIGTVEHHLRHEMPVGRIVARPDRVLEVLLGAVVLADRRLDPALGHDGVAVAEAAASSRG